MWFSMIFKQIPMDFEWISPGFPFAKRRCQALKALIDGLASMPVAAAAACEGGAADAPGAHAGAPEGHAGLGLCPRGSGAAGHRVRRAQGRRSGRKSVRNAPLRHVFGLFRAEIGGFCHGFAMVFTGEEAWEQLSEDFLELYEAPRPSGDRLYRLTGGLKVRILQIAATIWGMEPRFPAHNAGISIIFPSFSMVFPPFSMVFGGAQVPLPLEPSQLEAYLALRQRLLRVGTPRLAEAALLVPLLSSLAARSYERLPAACAARRLLKAS